ETRRELGRDYDEAILLSLAERLERTRRRPTALQEAVTTTIALGSIGLGILVALACANLGAVGGIGHRVEPEAVLDGGHDRGGVVRRAVDRQAVPQPGRERQRWDPCRRA